MSYQIKELLSASVVKKSSKHDPEKILYDHLYPKFGERFIEYRKKYEKIHCSDRSTRISKYSSNIITSKNNYYF